MHSVSDFHTDNCKENITASATKFSFNIHRLFTLCLNRSGNDEDQKVEFKVSTESVEVVEDKDETGAEINTSKSNITSNNLQQSVSEENIEDMVEPSDDLKQLAYKKRNHNIFIYEDERKKLLRRGLIMMMYQVLKLWQHQVFSLLQ